MTGGGRVERVENAKAARIEIVLHATAAGAFGEVLGRAILARQEALRQAEIGDDADLLAPAELAEPVLEAMPVDEIVFGLEHLIARAASRPGRRKRVLE